MTARVSRSLMLLSSAATLLSACTGTPERQAPAEPAERPEEQTYEALERSALAGEYQAQRNVAYWLSGDLQRLPTNQVLGCAWRLVIVSSGDPSVDATDAGNKKYYCESRLSPEEQAAAAAQAEEIKKRIATARASAAAP